MDFEGHLYEPEEDRYWLVEIPAFNLMSQGTSRKDALYMIKNAVSELLKEYFQGKLGRGFRLMIDEFEGNIFGIRATDNRFLLALALRRQREKSGATVREVARRLDVRSPNAYAQYEQARVVPSLQHYETLLLAANPSLARPRLAFGGS